MPRPECSPDENIVRAIHAADWDEVQDQKSSQIFKGHNISVSRLAVLDLPELLQIFHRDLDTSPNGVIVGAGEINVGKLQEIGRTFQHPAALTVEIEPVEGNPAHAEIPQKISRGLALAIIRTLTFHKG